MSALALILLLIVWLGAYAAVARWVYHDAERRGFGGLRAVALVSLLWPVGISVYLLLRSGRALAPRGWGSAWG